MHTVTLISVSAEARCTAILVWGTVAKDCMIRFVVCFLKISITKTLYYCLTARGINMYAISLLAWLRRP